MYVHVHTCIQYYRQAQFYTFRFIPELVGLFSNLPEFWKHPTKVWMKCWPLFPYVLIYLYIYIFVFLFLVMVLLVFFLQNIPRLHSRSWMCMWNQGDPCGRLEDEEPGHADVGHMLWCMPSTLCATRCTGDTAVLQPADCEPHGLNQTPKAWWFEHHHQGTNFLNFPLVASKFTITILAVLDRICSTWQFSPTCICWNRKTGSLHQEAFFPHCHCSYLRLYH